MYESPWTSWPTGSPVCGGIFDLDRKEADLHSLSDRANDPELWNQPELARKVMRDKVRIEKVIDTWKDLKSRLDDAEVALELAQEGDEPELAAEAESAATQIATALEALELAMQELLLLRERSLFARGGLAVLDDERRARESCDEEGGEDVREPHAQFSFA